MAAATTARTAAPAMTLVGRCWAGSSGRGTGGTERGGLPDARRGESAVASDSSSFNTRLPQFGGAPQRPDQYEPASGNLSPRPALGQISYLSVPSNSSM